MEVLKVGNAPLEWSATISCQKCAAQIKGKSSDLKTFYYYGTHFQHFYLAFVCPCCGEPTMLPKETLTKKIIAEYLDKENAVFDGFDDRIY